MLVQKQICCYTYVTRFVKTIPNITTSNQTQAMVIPINWPVSLISLLLPRHFSCHLHHNWLSVLWVHVVAQNKQPTSCESPDNWLVMLIINWATFCGVQVSNTPWLRPCISLCQFVSKAFTHHFLAAMTPMPTIHLYVSACSKLSKMVDNSSCLPKQLSYWKYLEQLQITGELHMCSFMSSWNTKFQIHTF